MKRFVSSRDSQPSGAQILVPQGPNGTLQGD